MTDVSTEMLRRRAVPAPRRREHRWASPGMDKTCSYSFTSAEPIVGLLLRIDRDWSGWILWVRHRHYGGLFEDCPPAEYSRLADDELLDVLEAEHSNWVARKSFWDV